MIHAIVNDRATEALLAGEVLKRKRELQAFTPHAALDGMSIAISRETGTHDTEIAHRLGERLGWQVYDHELLERMASDMHVRVGLLENVDERCVNWLQEATTMLSNVPNVRESQYVRQLVETTLTLGMEGRAVFVGRGAALILLPESTLRVALMAPLEHRIVTVMNERQLTHTQAGRYVAENDRRRAQFAKAHFCKEGIDPHLFDVVLNTARLSVDDCVELVVQALHDRAKRLGSA